MLKCPSCGRENQEHFNFCLDCGTEITARPPPAAPPPPMAAPAPPTAPVMPAAPPAPAFSASPHAAPSPYGAPPRAVVGSPVGPGFSPPMAPLPPEPGPGSAPPGGCPHCHAPVPAGMRFCGACGSRLDGSVPAPQPAGGAPAKTQFLHAPEVAVAQPKARLIVIDQTGKEGMQFNLKAAETLCGRVNGIILFFDDPYVSPSHCVFRFAGGRLSVEDVGSLNGVFLRLRSEVELQGGDMVRLGRQLVRFEDESALPPEEVRRGPDDDSRLWGSPEAKVFGRLVQVLEDGRVGDVRVLRGTEVRVGREVGDILFPMDGFVSGQHCLVSTRAGRVYLRDLGSSNGTYLRVRGPRELAQDDFLLMGNQLLRVDQR